MTLAGIEPATFRFVAQHLNHCATAVPIATQYEIKISAVKSYILNVIFHVSICLCREQYRYYLDIEHVTHQMASVHRQ